MPTTVFPETPIASKGHLFTPSRLCNRNTSITVRCQNDLRDTAVRPAAVSFLLSNDGGKAFCVANHAAFLMGPGVVSNQVFDVRDFSNFHQVPQIYYLNETPIYVSAQHQPVSFGPPWTHARCLLQGGEDSTVTMSVTEET